MDSEKLQKLANLAIVRQHAAAVTASTSFNRKYISDVNKSLGALDMEFIKTLAETVGDSVAEDTATISKRLAEEKAKLKAKAEPVTDKPEIEATTESVKSTTRPSIKTARVKKE